MHSKMLKETLSAGVAYLHEGVDAADRRLVQQLIESGAAQLVVVAAELAFAFAAHVHTVIIADTYTYNGKLHAYEQYPITTVLQMVGRACRPLEDDHSVAVLMCVAHQKQFFTKLLNDCLPLEMVGRACRLLEDDHSVAVLMCVAHQKLFFTKLLNDCLPLENTEIPTITTVLQMVGRACRPLEDDHSVAVLMCVAHQKQHLSDHLSELVETTLTDLEQSKCISIEDEMDPSAASGAVKYNDPHVKAHVLLQAHLSRMQLPAELHADTAIVLVKACVDVVSSSGWLSPAVAAMELAQMATQAMWAKDSYLRQLPHFTPELVQRCSEKGVDTVFDVMELEDNARAKLLQLSPTEMADVARFCNRYPNVELNYEWQVEDNARAKLLQLSPTEMADVARFCNRYPNVELNYEWQVEDNARAKLLQLSPTEMADVARFCNRYPNLELNYEHHLRAGKPIVVEVVLEREDDIVGPVIAPFFPQKREEGWWVVIGDPKNNSLLSIKRVSLARNAKSSPTA
ncbi:Pre-mRNA-splicing helicase BRR2 [Operophtera brumata]|uniref:Pre-mRNA-splicing helicase BRR2 n=1 Tax=Operophtera brumata TaxID=104452 RepID=A0A0L7KZ48_OPEBR|nr:Pre-mRNA-splicing helicase BRR2 [Operophtera brumata]